MVIDIDHLLSPVSPDQPCGEDLEYDDDFILMEENAQGSPERQIGSTIVPAEEADWPLLKKQCVALLGRSKDLRTASYLSKALIRTDGLAGLEDALTLLRGLIERFWADVHPLLDPDDDNDPTLRVNTLAELCDSDTMLRYVREAPLVEVRGIGQFSLRNIDIANGKLEVAKSDEQPNLSVIDGAFSECDVDYLESVKNAAQQAHVNVQALEQQLTEQVGVENATDLSPLADTLKEILDVLSERLVRRGVSPSAQAATAKNVDSAEQAASDGSQEGGNPRPSLSGEINSREDAARAIDKMCDYFSRYEPSSPVPLLLMRAKRLMEKDFMEILRDLAPDGVPQVEVIRGPEETETGTESGY